MLLVILAVTKFGRGFIANISVLLGIVIGAVVAALLGRMDFSAVGKAAAFGVVTPLQFGFPDFQIVPDRDVCALS